MKGKYEPIWKSVVKKIKLASVLGGLTCNNSWPMVNEEPIELMENVQQ